MTEKQEKILQSALGLFAKEGYHATSTNKVAKHACVSEGLIFRHFGNKEGLLTSILELGENKIKSLLVDIVMEPDPKEVIRKAIFMSARIDKIDYDFWKLQFKLKWELEVSSDKKMEPLKMALSNAFNKLGYEEPEQEAMLILLFIEGIGSAILKGSNMDANQMMKFLAKKYKI